MIRVEFMGPLSSIEAKELEAQSLAELREILSADVALKDWLKMSAVAVNDKLASDVNAPLKSGDKVVILPPVCGG